MAKKNSVTKVQFQPKSAAQRHKLLKIADLKPGCVYTITSDVANPNADRRTKDDWRREPIVRKGTRLYAIAVGDEIWLEPFARNVPLMPGSSDASDDPFVNLYYEVLLALDLATDVSVMDVLRGAEIGVSPDDILNVLVKLGSVKIEDVQTAVQMRVSELKAEAEELEEAMRAAAQTDAPPSAEAKDATSDDAPKSDATDDNAAKVDASAPKPEGGAAVTRRGPRPAGNRTATA